MDETGEFGGPIFLGEFDHSIDSQCRVSLPSEWRKECTGSLILMPGRDRSLVLIPAAAFLEMANHARKLAIANPEIQKSFAVIGSITRQCRCDKQGRLAIDRKMLDAIGAGNQVKLIGAINHIRLCPPDQWQSPDFDVIENCLDRIRGLNEEAGTGK